jgi:hypothetical protein
VTENIGATTGADIFCPSGVATGGGYALDGSDASLLTVAVVSSELNTSNGWSVYVKRVASPPAGDNASFLVTVVCASTT